MDDLIRYAPALAAGFLKNLQLAALCAVFSLMLGTMLVAMRVAPTPVLRALGSVYVNVLRNTPLTLVLAFSALGLSDTLGLTFSSTPGTNSFWLVVLGLSAYSRPSSAKCCAPASTPCRWDRRKPPARSG
jgi:glutamate transport system permease protein